jgi:hypothetical protein
VRPRDVAAAAALAAPFVLGLGALLVIAPASPGEAAAADPLIRLLRGAWPVVPIAAAILAAWLVALRPERRDLLRAARWAGAGALAALAVSLAVFAAFGETLPAFVPPEESARAGLTNGLAAGLVEEALFRFGVLPLAYAAARRRLGVPASIAMASGATALLFALSHELGPAGGAFELRYLVTRFAFPGLFMSLLFLRAHPAFIVTAHLAGHLAIPALFR